MDDIGRGEDEFDVLADRLTTYRDFERGAAGADGDSCRSLAGAPR